MMPLADIRAAAYPDQQLKIVCRDGHGAAHFTNSDPANGPVGAWLALADDPPTDAAPLACDPWDPERAILPPDVLLPINRLQQLTVEYATPRIDPWARTGKPWTSSDESDGIPRNRADHRHWLSVVCGTIEA